MQKIIAMFLAFIMSVFGLAPAVQPKDAYTQAQWYALVVDEFELTANLEDGDNYDIPAADEYYQVIQACYDWKVLVGEYDADAAITDVLVAESLAVAAGLEGTKVPNEAAMQIAIDAGIVSISVNLFGKIKESIISKHDANVSLGLAKAAYLDRLNNVKNGGNLTTVENDIVDMSDLSLIKNGSDLTLQAADGSVIGEDDIAALNYEGEVNPFAQPDAANIQGVSQQGILDNKEILDKIKGLVNVSFSIGDLKVKAALKDGGFDVSLGGNIKGVNITKAYEVRNFDLTTKFDGDLAKKQINEAYVLMDYDLKDTTSVSGSYAASVAEKELAENVTEGTDDLDFFTAVQNKLKNLEVQSGSDSVINVFTIDVPIPNCPAITVGITVKIVIAFDGRIDLVITSSETKGVYIEDNKIRTVSESKAGTTEATVMARVEATIALGVNVKIVSIVIIDADVQVGLGIKVTAYMTGGAANYKLDIPVDFLFDVNLTYPNAKNTTLKGNVKMYGIVKISVGQNSTILKKLGLKKTWTLLGEGNGTFLDKTFDIIPGQESVAKVA